jgi:hypothetical protein
MIGVRVLYALSLVNLALLVADLAYNVLAGLLGAAR